MSASETLAKLRERVKELEKSLEFIPKNLVALRWYGETELRDKKALITAMEALQNICDTRDDINAWSLAKQTIATIPEPDKEVDRRIGELLFAQGRISITDELATATKALAEAEGRLAEYRTRNDSLSQELGNASLKFMEENTAFSQRCAKLRDLLVESRGYLDRMGQEGIRERIDAILATEPNTSGEGK